MKFEDVEHVPNHHDELVAEAKEAIDLIFSDLDVESEKTAESLGNLQEYIQELKGTL